MDKFVPVTQENLHNPDPADWPMLGGNMAHWNYSSLDQINRENISSLQLVWARQMPTTGGRAATSPLIHKGIMYLISPNDALMAVDAVTGSRIWEYRRELPKAGEGPGLIRHNYSGPKRGIALYGDKIFTVASDNAVIALDARTGKVAWEVFRGGDGYVANTSGPIVANGILIAGGSCQNAPFGCYVTGHDITTGKELWRNEVIPRPGEPGDETWGGTTFESRWCTGVWGQIVYDPVLNLVHYGSTGTCPASDYRRGRRRQECHPGRDQYTLGGAAGNRRGRVAPPTPAAGQLGPGMHVRDDARRHADASESESGGDARGQSEDRDRQGADAGRHALQEPGVLGARCGNRRVLLRQGNVPRGAEPLRQDRSGHRPGDHEPGGGLRPSRQEDLLLHLPFRWSRRPCCSRLRPEAEHHDPGDRKYLHHRKRSGQSQADSGRHLQRRRASRCKIRTCP